MFYQVRHFGPKRSDSFKAALNIINEDSSPVMMQPSERKPDSQAEEPSREQEFRKKVVENPNLQYEDLMKLVHLQQHRLSDQTSQLNNFDTGR